MVKERKSSLLVNVASLIWLIIFSFFLFLESFPDDDLFALPNSTSEAEERGGV